MEGICPEASHLAHNHEPGISSGLHLHYRGLTTAQGNHRPEIAALQRQWPNVGIFIYFRRQQVNFYACKRLTPNPAHKGRTRKWDLACEGF